MSLQERTTPANHWERGRPRPHTGKLFPAKHFWETPAARKLLRRDARAPSCGSLLLHKAIFGAKPDATFKLRQHNRIPVGFQFFPPTILFRDASDFVNNSVGGKARSRVSQLAFSVLCQDAMLAIVSTPEACVPD